MNYRKIVLKNTISSVALQFVIALFGFITPVLLIKNYGSEINGIVSSINQVIRYFTLIEAGLGGASVYLLVSFLSKGDIENTNIVLSYTRKKYVKMSGIIVAIVILTTPIYAYITNSQEINKITIGILFLIFGFTTASEFLIMSKCRVLLNADQKTYYISLWTIVFTVISQIMSIVLIVSLVDIIIIYLVSLSVNLLRGYTLNRVVKKMYKDRINFKSYIPKNYKIDMQKDVFLHEVFYTIISALPIVTVSIMFDFNKASIYTVYNMPIIMINIILATIYQSISATYMHKVNENNIESENLFYKNFVFVYISIATILLVMTAVLITPFINLYTRNITDINYLNSNLGYLLIAFSVINTLRVVFAIPTSSHGFFKQTSKVAIFIMFTSIAISVFIGYYLTYEFVLLGPIFGFTANAIYQYSYQKKNIPSFRNTFTWALIIISFAFITVIYVYSRTIVHIYTWLEFFLFSTVAIIPITLITFITFYIIYQLTKRRVS
jgi:O-antigen/teichoic acid export membrane protein